jgi:hypothetical protein
VLLQLVILEICSYMYWRRFGYALAMIWRAIGEGMVEDLYHAFPIGSSHNLFHSIIRITL